MTIEKTWTVKQMPCLVQSDGDCTVASVHWELKGTDGANTVVIPGNTSLTRVEGTAYTPYAQLTQEQVITWIKDAMGTEQVDRYYTMLERQLALKAAPTPPRPVTRVLPWATIPFLPS